MPRSWYYFQPLMRAWDDGQVESRWGSGKEKPESLNAIEFWARYNQVLLQDQNGYVGYDNFTIVWKWNGSKWERYLG
jgi:hypothetical protein